MISPTTCLFDSGGRSFGDQVESFTVSTIPSNLCPTSKRTSGNSLENIEPTTSRLSLEMKRNRNPFKPQPLEGSSKNGKTIINALESNQFQLKEVKNSPIDKVKDSINFST
jgi:hypothetical protein